MVGMHRHTHIVYLEIWREKIHQKVKHFSSDDKMTSEYSKENLTFLDANIRL